LSFSIALALAESGRASTSPATNPAIKRFIFCQQEFPAWAVHFLRAHNADTLDSDKFRLHEVSLSNTGIFLQLP
jgi:hypothetical protein